MESDDLPERARWTIIFTAVLLLVMCLFLVGITLRMAPLIDDIGKALLSVFRLKSDPIKRFSLQCDKKTKD